PFEEWGESSAPNHPALAAARERRGARETANRVGKDQAGCQSAMVRRLDTPSTARLSNRVTSNQQRAALNANANVTRRCHAAVLGCGTADQMVVSEKGFRFPNDCLRKIGPMTTSPRPRVLESASEAQPEYKRTLFDRLGPDAALVIRSSIYGLATFAIT